MNDATWDERYGIAPGGYRLPAHARLGPVRLQVGDLARSVSFYEQVLGLHVVGAAAGAPLPRPGAGSDVVLAAHDDDQPLVIPSPPGHQRLGRELSAARARRCAVARVGDRGARRG